MQGTNTQQQTHSSKQQKLSFDRALAASLSMCHPLQQAAFASSAEQVTNTAESTKMEATDITGT
jgi:hypothetical protein